MKEEKEKTTPEPVEMTTDRIQTIFSETTELFESSVQDILKQQSARHSPDAILVILMAIKSNCQQFINSFDVIIREEEGAEEEPETTPVTDHDPIVAVETLTAEVAGGINFPEGSPYEWVVACFHYFSGRKVYLPWDLVNVTDDPAYPDGVRILPAVEIFELLVDFYFSEKLKDAMQQIHGSERKITTTFFQGKEYNFVIDHGEPLPDDLLFNPFVFIGTGKESETTYEQ